MCLFFAEKRLWRFFDVVTVANFKSVLYNPVDNKMFSVKSRTDLDMNQTDSPLRGSHLIPKQSSMLIIIHCCLYGGGAWGSTRKDSGYEN